MDKCWNEIDDDDDADENDGKIDDDDDDDDADENDDHNDSAGQIRRLWQPIKAFLLAPLALASACCHDHHDDYLDYLEHHDDHDHFHSNDDHE